MAATSAADAPPSSTFGREEATWSIGTHLTRRDDSAPDNCRSFPALVVPMTSTTRPSLPVIAVARQRALLDASSELCDICGRYILKPDAELRAELREIPQDVTQLEQQGRAVLVCDLAAPITKDLLDLSRHLTGFIGQPERGVDD